MKYPVANISFEGQGWNPYSLVLDEGKEAFTKRVIEDGHYQKGEDGMGYTEGQRKTIAGKAFDQAQAYVNKHPLPQDEAPDAGVVDTSLGKMSKTGVDNIKKKAEA